MEIQLCAFILLERILTIGLGQSGVSGVFPFHARKASVFDTLPE